MAYLLSLRNSPQGDIVFADMLQVYVQPPAPLAPRLFSWPEACGSTVSGEAVAQRVLDEYGVPIELQRLCTLGGRALPVGGVEHGATVQVCLAVVGGKGGFGSMLRSQGGKMASKVSTNFEACRDLHGRRLRLVTHAKEIRTYQEKKEREEKERKEAKRRKIEAILNEDEPKKVFFSDPNFRENTEKVADEVQKAVIQGVELEKQRRETETKKKREREEAEKAAAKRLSLWGEEGVSLSSSDDENDHSDTDSNSASTKTASDEKESSSVSASSSTD